MPVQYIGSTSLTFIASYILLTTVLFLHMVNPNYDQLGKVRPILIHLKNKLSSLFTPGRDQSINKVMVPFKGCSCMNHAGAHIPKKSLDMGLKF